MGQSYHFSIGFGFICLNKVVEVITPSASRRVIVMASSRLFSTEASREKYSTKVESGYPYVFAPSMTFFLCSHSIIARTYEKEQLCGSHVFLMELMGYGACIVHTYVHLIHRSNCVLHIHMCNV